MFLKPYKVKSINTLKNSEKKSLVQRCRDEFPNAPEDGLKDLVPVKSATVCLRVVCANGEAAAVFAVDGVPMLLEARERLVPTVAALWRMPDLLPTLNIQGIVLPKLVNGAPLYVPGVSVAGGGVGFPMFKAGALVAAATADNGAAALVGRAAMGSADVLLRSTGVCVEPLQLCGDLLCREPKLSKLERPQQPPKHPAPSAPAPADYLAGDFRQLNIKSSMREEWPSLGGPRRSESTLPAPAPAPPMAVSAPASAPPAAHTMHTDYSDDVEKEDLLTVDDGGGTGQEQDEWSLVPAEMDALLRWSMLAFAKLEAKHVEFPLMANLLYKNHLIPLCSPARSLDVKKSSYKKMGKFLDAMQEEGLIEVAEVEKGVLAVTGIQATHPAVREAYIPKSVKSALASRRAPAPPAVDYVPPTIRDMLCVTAHVADVFGVKKGTAFTPSEARSTLTAMVRARGLDAGRGSVALNSALAKLMGKQELDVVRLEEVWATVSARMTPATELRADAAAAPKLLKTRLEPVRISVHTRSGNKKVTLVSNLESYGFELTSLARACQQAAGAACGVAREPAANKDQLMLQGDQTLFVAKLLIEKYGLPKKFLEGADKALSKKK